MPGVFINYRRDDRAGWVWAVHGRLESAFGDDIVILDVKDIAMGEDYADFITKQLQLIDVLLAIIGPSWITIADVNGRPRLEDPEDLLRREIAMALSLDIDVIPVLVDNAEMPSSGQLPDNVKRLAALSAFKLRPDRFDTDVEKLVAVVGEKMGVDPQSIDRAQDFVSRLDSQSHGVPDGKQDPPTVGEQMTVLPESRLSFDSDKGDWVGQGLTMTLTPTEYDFTLWEQTKPHSLWFELDDERSSWSVTFEAPRGERLSVGAYSQAEGAMKRHSRPGFDLSGDGRACSDIEAEFEIKRLDRNERRTVVVFEAEFAQRCGGDSAALRGSLHYYAERRQ
jgi:hypothetical protein